VHARRSCRDLVAAISDYIDGELTATRCRDLEAHLSACPCCDRFTDSLRRAVAVCRASGATRLPKSVQVRARARIAGLLASLPPPAVPTVSAGTRARSRSVAPARRRAGATARPSGTRTPQA
jgi:anti-sigma factor RsiW